MCILLWKSWKILLFLVWVPAWLLCLYSHGKYEHLMGIQGLKRMPVPKYIYIGDSLTLGIRWSKVICLLTFCIMHILQIQPLDISNISGMNFFCLLCTPIFTFSHWSKVVQWSVDLFLCCMNICWRNLTIHVHKKLLSRVGFVVWRNLILQCLISTYAVKLLSDLLCFTFLLHGVFLILI